MRRIVLVVAGSLLLPLGTTVRAAAPAGSGPSAVIARVNGEPILERDFNLAVQMEFRRRGPGQRGLEDLRAIRERILQTLIDNEIMHQEAVRLKINVRDADVKAELRRLKDGFDSQKQFAAYFEGSGVSESDLREQIRRKLVVNRFIDQKVAGDARVTDEQVRHYYDEHPGQMVRPAGVRISQIVVRVPPGASARVRSAARRKIEQILKELRAGKDFAELARLHSEGPGAERGGDSGFVSRGSGALPAVENAALLLKPGETSDIVETLRGFHIIRATDARAQGVIPFDEAKEVIHAMLNAARRDEAIRDYLAGLRDSYRVERMLPEGP